MMPYLKKIQIVMKIFKTVLNSGQNIQQGGVKEVVSRTGTNKK